MSIPNRWQPWMCENPHHAHHGNEVEATATLAFTIPKSLWMSANDRPHWAVKMRQTRELRRLGMVTARNAGLSDVGTCHVAAFIGYPGNGKADPSNAAPTIKALIDGMTDAGVWPDDDHTHVVGPTYLRDPKTGQVGVHSVRLVLTTQEVPF